jgi:hypothetical protein
MTLNYDLFILILFHDTILTKEVICVERDDRPKGLEGSGHGLFHCITRNADLESEKLRTP